LVDERTSQLALCRFTKVLNGFNPIERKLVSLQIFKWKRHGRIQSNANAMPAINRLFENRFLLDFRMSMIDFRILRQEVTQKWERGTKIDNRK
jgi:hypothetical protein